MGDMTLGCAVSIIENCAGFTEEDTPVGEAWSVVLQALARVAELESGRPLSLLRRALEVIQTINHENHAGAERVAEAIRIELGLKKGGGDG